MAAPVGAFVIKDALVTVNSTEYANQCTRSILTPDTPIQTVRTLVPDGAVQDVDSPVWTWGVQALQINQAGGLARALRALEPGDEATIVIAPKNADGEQQAAFTIKAMPVEFGGDQGSWAMFEKVFAVVGQPVFSDIEIP